MKLKYVKVGDYYIPALSANAEPEEPLTKYGLMRKNYLKEHRRGIYSGMMLDGRLKSHCLMVQRQAEMRMDTLMGQMAKEQGVDEQLKISDQMRWVRMMNNIKAAAEEIVTNEIIYT